METAYERYHDDRVTLSPAEDQTNSILGMIPRWRLVMSDVQI